MQRSNHEASLLTIETLFGWVADSEQFILALQTGRRRSDKEDDCETDEYRRTLLW
jgi:hypothetical protein